MRAIAAARADGLTIGKLAQLTGVKIETIRYGIDRCPPKAKVTRSNRVGCANVIRHLRHFMIQERYSG